MVFEGRGTTQQKKADKKSEPFFVKLFLKDIPGIPSLRARQQV